MHVELAYMYRQWPNVLDNFQFSLCISNTSNPNLIIFSQDTYEHIPDEDKNADIGN